MELVLSKIFLLIFFISFIYIIYYILRLVHLYVGLKNDTINQTNFADIKEELFSGDKLKILWFSLAYILFFIFK